MDLIIKLRDHSKEVRRKAKAAYGNEANTREYLIKPFLEVLGYDTTEPNDVAAEFTADIGKYNEKVDYALKKNGRPVILVEFKAASEVLSRKHTAQLQRYINSKLDVRFGVLTNGIEYQFYADLEKENVMDDDAFLTVDMRHLNDDHCAGLSLFTKSGFDVETCLDAARTLKYRQRIKDVLNQTFDPLSDEIVKLLVKKVYSGSYTKFVRDQFTPLVKQAWVEFVNSKKVTIEPITDPIGQQPKQVSTGSSLELPVSGTYNGQQFDATLILKERFHLLDKQNMRFHGALMNHAVAATEAAREIDEGVDYVVGWTFWEFHHPDTKELTPIKELFENETLRNRMRSRL